MEFILKNFPTDQSARIFTIAFKQVYYTEYLFSKRYGQVVTCWGEYSPGFFCKQFGQVVTCRGEYSPDFNPSSEKLKKVFSQKKKKNYEREIIFIKSILEGLNKP